MTSMRIDAKSMRMTYGGSAEIGEGGSGSGTSGWSKPAVIDFGSGVEENEEKYGY